MEIKGLWESYLYPHSGVSRGTSEQLVAECLMVRGERPAAVLIHEARAAAAGKAVTAVRTLHDPQATRGETE